MRSAAHQRRAIRRCSIIGLLAIIGGFVNAAQVTMMRWRRTFTQHCAGNRVGVATSVGRVGANPEPIRGNVGARSQEIMSFFTLVAAAMAGGIPCHWP